LLREAFFCALFFWRRVFTWGNSFFLRDDASSPGGDASPRRYCQVGGRSPNLAMRKCIVFACQGIEPCQANADAGTRRPQVRTCFLLVMKKINDRLMKRLTTD